jgi:hypothetical protein
VSAEEKQAELRERLKNNEAQRQKEMQEEQAALQAAMSGGGDGRGLVKELISSEDIQVGDGRQLQSRTVAKLDNMVSRDWVLGNLTPAQEHEIRFKLEVMRLKILGMHPPEEGVSGAERAFLMDDSSERLEPLTQQERLLIDELIDTLKARVGRGREGFERRQENTDIARTETGTDDAPDSSSGWGGLFG